MSGPSHRVLQETPLRALAFLRGMARNTALRSVLGAHGFREADRNEGLRLIAATCPERRDVLDVPLHAWFTDWATTARSVVERKDWLILLGLAERRRR